MTNERKIARQLEFLRETLAYYGEDTSRRSAPKDYNCCRYIDQKSGNCCAIGRHILPGKYSESMESQAANAVLRNYKECFPKWLRSLGQRFVLQIQHFHDTYYFWGEKEGLTLHGKLFYDELENKILNGAFIHLNQKK